MREPPAIRLFVCSEYLVRDIIGCCSEKASALWFCFKNKNKNVHWVIVEDLKSVSCFVCVLK